MANRQRHRGRHPKDDVIFAQKCLPKLRKAVFDLCFLFSRGYNDTAACKVVGDRYQLTSRQRAAILRSSCAEQSVRLRHEKKAQAIWGKTLCLDGYNILITVETMLSGGLLFCGADGCIRDLASVHGSYRKVEETVPALKTIGETLVGLGVKEAHWYFDSPVSNSGRLASLLRELAAKKEWPWVIEVVRSPDAVLKESLQIITTSDGVVLDECHQWFDLLHPIYEGLTDKPPLLDLREVTTTSP